LVYAPRDFLLRKQPTAPIMQKIACITLDVESDFLDPTGRIRLFEDDALFNRYVNIIKKYDVKVTAFLVTSLIQKHADSYRRLQDQIPIEFAVHSHMHDMKNPCSRADIEEAFRTFRAFTGQTQAATAPRLDKSRAKGCKPYSIWAFVTTRAFILHIVRDAWDTTISICLLSRFGLGMKRNPSSKFHLQLCVGCAWSSP